MNLHQDAEFCFLYCFLQKPYQRKVRKHPAFAPCRAFYSIRQTFLPKQKNRPSLSQRFIALSEKTCSFLLLPGCSVCTQAPFFYFPTVVIRISRCPSIRNSESAAFIKILSPFFSSAVSSPENRLPSPSKTSKEQKESVVILLQYSF